MKNLVKASALSALIRMITLFANGLNSADTLKKCRHCVGTVGTVLSALSALGVPITVPTQNPHKLITWLELRLTVPTVPTLSPILRMGLIHLRYISCDLALGGSAGSVEMGLC